MELWKRNFQDTETFIQFYFSRKYSDNHALVYEENGKALSALLMLPYPMNWQGISLETAYISGACTLQEARNHGYMTQLLKEALATMHQKGVALSTLIPAEKWLFDYYGKLGYVTVFDYSTEKYQMNDAPEHPFVVHCPPAYDANFTQNLFPYFDQKMSGRTCCIQHPAEDYLAIVEETYLSGGRLATAQTPGSASSQGWALAVPEQGIVRIKECFYESQQVRQVLCQYFSALWQNAPVEYRTLPQGKNSRHYGMARITNAGIMLQRIAQIHPNLSISISLHDTHLPANEGIYLLSQGECHKKEYQKMQTDIETDVPTLTKALLGYHPEQLPRNLADLADRQTPFMNLMMD
ncbi:MAG: GNAT family N-acetyltransferase [Odoribacter sp.]|nr:GNAT family N-acetyltransferase [Odoribacter sp.]